MRRSFEPIRYTINLMLGHSLKFLAYLILCFYGTYCKFESIKLSLFKKKSLSKEKKKRKI